MTLPIHPISSASPDLDKAETLKLQESIKQLGQLVPIVTYQGQVLDGRKRQAACQNLKIEPKYIEVTGDPVQHAQALNLLRTHYTVGQRSMYAATIANLAKGQRADLLKKSADTRIRVSSPISIPTAAKQVGVNPRRVQEALVVRQAAIPEVTKAVESGKLSLYAAKEIAKRPQDTQQALLTQALATKTSKGVVVSGTLRPRYGQRGRTRTPNEAIDALLTSMVNTADVLKGYCDKPLPQPVPAEWCRMIDTIRGVLSKFFRRADAEKVLEVTETVTAEIVAENGKKAKEEEPSV